MRQPAAGRRPVTEGARLAAPVRSLALADPVILALPRGGVPVAFEVAVELGAALDVMVARKMAVPEQPERGIGAVAEGGACVVDPGAVTGLGLAPGDVDELARLAGDEVERRVRRYRGERPLPEVAGRPVVLIDDGLATGVTAEAALRSLRARAPGRLVLAVPVAARPSLERMEAVADDIVCLLVPDDFTAVGAWYENFRQTSDDEVLRLLAAAAAAGPVSSGGSEPARHRPA